MELPEDEVPGEDIWHHAERLQEWFEAVKHRRKEGMEPIDTSDDSGFEENELTKGLK